MPAASTLSPGAVAMLRERQFAHMVTLMPDGSPQPTIVWIDAELDGSYVLVNSSVKRLKLRNIQRDPRVCISVLDPEDEFRWVIVRGVVEEIRQEGAEAHYQSLSLKYDGRRSARVGLDERRILRIRPQHVRVQGVAGSPVYARPDEA